MKSFTDSWERVIPKGIILRVMQDPGVPFADLYIFAKDLGYGVGKGNLNREHQKFRQYLSDNQLVSVGEPSYDKPLVSKKQPGKKEKLYFLSYPWLYSTFFRKFSLSKSAEKIGKESIILNRLNDYVVGGNLKPFELFHKGLVNFLN